MNLTLCLSHFLTTLSFSHNLFIHCCSSVLDIKCQSLCIVLAMFQKVKHVFHSWQIVFKLFYCSVFGVKIAFNVMSHILGRSWKSIISHELDVIQNQSFLIKTQNWWPTNWFRMFANKLVLDSAPWYVVLLFSISLGQVARFYSSHTFLLLFKHFYGVVFIVTRTRNLLMLAQHNF